MAITKFVNVTAATYGLSTSAAVPQVFTSSKLVAGSIGYSSVFYTVPSGKIAKIIYPLASVSSSGVNSSTGDNAVALNVACGMYIAGQGNSYMGGTAGVSMTMQAGYMLNVGNTVTVSSSYNGSCSGSILNAVSISGFYPSALTQSVAIFQYNSSDIYGPLPIRWPSAPGQPASSQIFDNTRTRSAFLSAGENIAFSISGTYAANISASISYNFQSGLYYDFIGFAFTSNIIVIEESAL